MLTDEELFDDRVEREMKTKCKNRVRSSERYSRKSEESKNRRQASRQVLFDVRSRSFVRNSPLIKIQNESDVDSSCGENHKATHFDKVSSKTYQDRRRKRSLTRKHRRELKLQHVRKAGEDYDNEVPFQKRTFLVMGTNLQSVPNERIDFISNNYSPSSSRRESFSTKGHSPMRRAVSENDWADKNTKAILSKASQTKTDRQEFATTLSTLIRLGTRIGKQKDTVEDISVITKDRNRLQGPNQSRRHSVYSDSYRCEWTAVLFIELRAYRKGHSISFEDEDMMKGRARVPAFFDEIRALKFSSGAIDTYQYDSNFTETTKFVELESNYLDELSINYGNASEQLERFWALEEFYPTREAMNQDYPVLIEDSFIMSRLEALQMWYNMYMELSIKLDFVAHILGGKTLHIFPRLPRIPMSGGIDNEIDRCRSGSTFSMMHDESTPISSPMPSTPDQFASSSIFGISRQSSSFASELALAEKDGIRGIINYSLERFLRKGVKSIVSLIEEKVWMVWP